MSQKVFIQASTGRYAVIYRRGALRTAGALAARAGLAGRIFLLSSSRVWKHWGATTERAFARFGGFKKILFDDRESAKHLRTVEVICRDLLRAGADRKSVIVALGGGVVGDVAGFVAASYMRGVKLVHIPTTLVAQVDSAIGGKTGVNLPDGKNLVGAFYPPSLVIADPEVLSTLPAREYRSGLYEVIKYAVIGDRGMFEELEKRIEALVRKDRKALDWAIPRCITQKGRIVSQDEHESGLREVLNFGHTFGHALEAATSYKRFLHGEAVGWGVIAAARLAVEMNYLKRHEAGRIENLVRRVGKLPSLPRIHSARFLSLMRSDKKARGRQLRFVLLRRIGKAEAMGNVAEGVVLRVLASCAEKRIL
ncbi:MAG: 3-dehydroquinate synthase [Acidobacteria bacterium]|nr:3-dehydroquinate synthase [Acidobacteriota bacterium]